MPHCSKVSVSVFSSWPELAPDDSLFEAMKEQTVTVIIIVDAAAASLQTNIVKPF